MAKQKNESNSTKPIETYGTNKEDVVCQMNDVKIKNVFNVDSNDTVVIAKDKNGFYVTAKSIVGTHLLDPYKMYKRVSAIERDGKYEFKTLN